MLDARIALICLIISCLILRIRVDLLFSAPDVAVTVTILGKSRMISSISNHGAASRATDIWRMISGSHYSYSQFLGKMAIIQEPSLLQSVA